MLTQTLFFINHRTPALTIDETACVNHCSFCWETCWSTFEKPSVTALSPGCLPVDARAVPPGFPQAAGGVYVVPVRQERVDAVESVGSVQMPPAAGRMWLMVVVLAPMLIFHPAGGVAEGLLHAATVLLNGVERRRTRPLPPQIVLVELVLAVV